MVCWFAGAGADGRATFEYAKVRHLYAAQLKLADRAGIDWSVGPHTIQGQGTYPFLHKHLRWPARE